MAIVSKDELLSSLKEKFTDDTSDETLALIENVSDTITDLETKTADQTNWKQKYEENDAEWRNKYKERFFSGGDETDMTNHSDVNDAMGGNEEVNEPMTFDDLFTVKE